MNFEMMILTREELEFLINNEKQESKFTSDIYLKLFENNSFNGIIIVFNKFLVGHILFSVVLEESEIIDLEIKKKYQNLGLAKHLLLNFAEKVKLYGVEKIFLEVSTENFSAKKLYYSLGFKKIGLRKDYYKVDNKFLDAENLYITTEKLINNTKKVKKLSKKIFVKTFGCQMNFYDSDRIKDYFKIDGFNETLDIFEADLVVINTCHIREKASEKLFSELGRIKKIKEIKNLKIAVSGCVAQAEGKLINKRAPYVDFIVGPQSYHLLPEMFRDSSGEVSSIQTDFMVNEKFENLPLAFHSNKNFSSFVTVQEGCDKFCTFCVVPYTRGSEYSRVVSEIYDEVKNLTEKGIVEVTLLGQNVNAWHGKSIDGKERGLGYLIHQLSKIDNLKRIRYTTSHPLDMDEELIEAHRDIEKLMPYLHLPVQSGSNKILKKMNRKHSTKEYLCIIEKIRKFNPDIAISGDFIVGFPGETISDFKETIALINEVKYSQAYSFKFSQRPGTPASLMDNQIDDEIKKSRLYEVQDILKKHQMEFNSKFLGKKINILLEKKGNNKNQFIGKSPWMQSVNIEKNNLQLGQIENVEVTFCGQNSLRAI